MDRRKPLLVNIGEVSTDEALREAAARNGARVSAKVRVADALDINHSGLSDDEFSYALKAHFDFLVSERKSTLPLFAVEFDEPHHDTDPHAMTHDRMKGEICAKLGLDLYRFDADYLRTVGRFTLLGWLVDLWFLHEAFYEAQDRGEIDWEDDFTYFSIFDPTEKGFEPVYDLSLPARLAFQEARWKGLTKTGVPEVLSQWGDDAGRFSVAYAIVPLSDGDFVIGEARCRLFGGPRGKPVPVRDLVTDLALVDAAAKLEEHQRGAYKPVDRDGLAALRAMTGGWDREGQLLDDIPT